MTFGEAAQAMRRLADVIDQVVAKHGDGPNGKPEPMLNEQSAVGAAALLCYIRDLFTNSARFEWDTPTILVLLEAISRDDELFPCGVARIMWDAEEKGSQISTKEVTPDDDK